MSKTQVEYVIAEAAKVIYREYGANLAAFWRDALAAEAQRNGEWVDRYNVDGNCIHSVPICRRCQLVTIEAHLKEKDAIRAEADAASPNVQATEVIDYFERESAKMDQQIVHLKAGDRVRVSGFLFELAQDVDAWRVEE